MQNSGAAASPLRTSIASSYWRGAEYSALVSAGAIALLLGGREWLLLALVLLPLPYLLKKPKIALVYALAFLPVAVCVLPLEFRDWGDTTAPQMYYWAAGLLIVLIPVGLSIWRRLRPFKPKQLKQAAIPASLIALFAISIAASVQGLRLGGSPSYVLRQLYGVMVLCVGFVATVLLVQNPAEVRLVLRRFRWLILALSCYTILFYLRSENVVGFFKGNISIFSATLAVYCAGEFLCAHGLRHRIAWVISALLFVVHPILFASRGAVGLVGVTALGGLGLKARSRGVKYFAIGGSLIFLFASISYNLFGGLSHALDRYDLLRRLVPADIIMDPDALGRISQFLAAVDAAREHPLLGLGLGSTLTWFEASIGGDLEASLVDNGWAYILSKMGLLGVFAFGWFTLSVLKRVGFPRQNGLYVGLWLAALFQLLYMVVGGIMVHFVYALWAGTTWGLLIKLKQFECEDQTKNPAWLTV